MTNEQRLFQTMMENPEDMDLRLVIADWYQEQGDPRGEFIQIQIALDRLPRRHIWRADIRRREGEFLAEHRNVWDAPLHQFLNQTAFKGRVRARRGDVRGWEYRRGFVEYIRANAGVLMDSLATFLQLGPLCSARIWNIRHDLPRFRRWEGLRRFVKLDLRHDHLNDAGREELLNSPHLENLRELNLVDTGLTDLSVDRLTAGEQLPSLKRLVLSQNPFSQDGWERLLFHFGERLEHENGTQPLTRYTGSYRELRTRVFVLR